jgi:hypothetical protein
MTSIQCFTRHQDQMYAILNWRIRASEFDVIVLQPLTEHELQAYEALAELGKSEYHIFYELFPPSGTPQKQVLIDFSLLTKDQLVSLINLYLNISLPSLRRMKKEDLQKLYLSLESDKRKSG